LKRAFSLIELIIVVVIMGVVYTLAVNNFELIKDKKINVNLKNIKQYLKSIEHNSSVELLCLDDCSTCIVYVDDKVYKDANDFDEFLDESIEVYSYDFQLGFQEYSKKVYFDDHGVEKNVCFSFGVDEKGVSDQIVVVFKDKVYDFTSYFDGVVVYNSLSQLSDKKAEDIEKILQ
jgi:prepilin-type N-terminal cleavage/methylation domain-containing protein